MDSPTGVIPEHLISADMRAEAIAWLTQQVWPGYVKREYLFAWARTVGVQLTQAEVVQVESSGPTPERRS